jgi:uncharacterized protein
MTDVQAAELLIGAVRLAAVGVAVYGAALFVRQKSIVFQARQRMLPLPARLAARASRVSLATKHGEVKGWWVEGDARSERVVLLLPGSIGNVSHEIDTMAFVLEQGASVLAVDYPGFGASEGRPSEAGVYDAARAAYDFLVRERGVASSNVVVFGRSLGGAPAMWLAASEPCRGLILHSCFLSVPDVAAQRFPLLPVRPFCLIRFDARRSVSSIRCSTLFIHSRDDRVIPFRLGEHCFSRFHAPKRLLDVSGDHHGSVWTRDPRVAEAMQQLWTGGALRWT